MSTATDVFACGILFYELLSGHRPFAEHEGTLGAMIGAHDAPIKRMPSIKRRAISRDLNAIVSLALRREPNERYESAAAFADDIKRFLNDETVRAVHGARWYAFSKFVKRHRGAWLIGAASTLALIGLGIYAAYQYALNQRMRVQAETVARVMSGVISGMSPTNSDNQLVHPKELLDRSVNSLGERAFESVLALKFSDLYQTIGEYDSAIRLVDRSLGARQNSGDHNASVRLLASKANAFLGLKQVSEAQQAMAKARADLGAHAWQVSDTSRVTLFLTEGRVAVARDALDEADSAYGEARHQMERRGDNDDDMLTLAIDGQATVARRRDRFARAVELLADANAAALRYGEISAPLRLGRILTDGQLQMELGDPVAAVRLFDAFYEDAKVRYSASHITRVYGGLMLAKALYQSGERERAGTILDGLASGTRLGPPYLSVRPGPARHALFFRSVIGSRWDVMLDYWQVRLLVPPTDDRFPFDEDLQAKELLALEATPNDWMSGIANRTKFGWMAAPTDRAKLALGVAKRQVIRIQSVGVEKWLDVAESAFHTNVTGERLALAEAWVIRAITRMRERDFASSKDLLTRAHHVYQTVLGDANPRTLAINVYLALAEAGASDRTASVSLPVVPALSRLQESYSAKRMLEPLSAWITTNRDTPNWAELPLFSP